MRIHLFGLLALACYVPITEAVMITTNTAWDNCQLGDIENAGDYYSSSIQSASSSVNCSNAMLSVTGLASSTTTWTVSANLLEPPSSQLKIELLRVGDGMGNSLPTGGISYLHLSTAPQVFFSGQGNTVDIPIQFKLSNLNTSDPHGLKNLKIEYQISTSN